MSRTTGVVMSALASAMTAAIVVLLLGSSPAAPPSPIPAAGSAAAGAGTPNAQEAVRHREAERGITEQVAVGVGAAVSGTPRP